MVEVKDPETGKVRKKTKYSKQLGDTIPEDYKPSIHKPLVVQDFKDSLDFEVYNLAMMKRRFKRLKAQINEAESNIATMKKLGDAKARETYAKAQGALSRAQKQIEELSALGIDTSAILAKFAAAQAASGGRSPWLAVLFIVCPLSLEFVLLAR